MALTIPVLSNKKEADSVSIPSEWTADISTKAVAQAVRIYHDRRHPGLARVKNRGEVALTTKKMYRQKHTGNARHGAASAPIFVGGGVTHGPKGLKRKLVLTDSVKRGSLKTAISAMLRAKKVAAIEASALKKTAEAASLISKLNVSSVLVALKKDNWDKAKVFRNIKGVTPALVDTVNAYEILKHQFVLFDSHLFEAKKEAKKTVSKTQKKA